jgi:hypothetical protein
MNRTQQPISTFAHGVLDLATVGFALTYASLFSRSRLFSTAVTGLALGKLGYALATKHEIGVCKVIPMKTHLALDSFGGAALVALPFLTRERSAIATCCAVAMGLFDIAAAPLTQTDDKEGASATAAADRMLEAEASARNTWFPQTSSMPVGVGQ